MYTLKGIFPEPKKEQKRNFIRENKKQLKSLQSKEPRTVPRPASRPPPHPQRAPGVAPMRPDTLTTKSKKVTNVQIKKGDMAEFLKRKEQRHKHQEESTEDEEDQDVKLTESAGTLRDMGCQTVESNLAQSFAEGTKLTVLYPRKQDDTDGKSKASGDMASHLLDRDSELFEADKRSRLTAILERKDKDPYLPSVLSSSRLPERRSAEVPAGAAGVGGRGGGAGAGPGDAECPPGHVALPDTERKETLRMLRNSFAELVSELNKLPVRTDSLRTRTRKMELERQLAKLEDGIKVFSRPRVFVRIGE
ncbi:unnamed protein product [Plutella xylostella]|uniref:(diamondback moth) hypothetical protein n=1 Tax=Plutella xylostella TaxID=51655 RepID=A0A8S4G4P4_PLUXY|nr:unnamed protein product [Plutella xylostella]